MKKRFQLLALSVLCVIFVHAQYVAPSEGVFRIINVAYDAALAENLETNTIRCTSNIGGNEDYQQLWILKKKSGSNKEEYSLQNALTAAYIQAGNDGQEVPYWTETAVSYFNIGKATKENTYNIWDPTLNPDPTLGQKGFHSKGANGNVVRWFACDASEWKFEKVEVSENALKLAQVQYAEYVAQEKKKDKEFSDRYTYLQTNRKNFEEILAKYFEDAACTILKKEFASISEKALNEALNKEELPTELTNMVLKVRKDNWNEKNEKTDKPQWDSDYAKKFRVQLIEPYSIAGEITEWIGHQGHTNMDNPTGLYANKREVLYIMVSDTIKEGAELWANWIVGHDKMPNYNNGYSNGTRLKKGLNIIPMASDGSALYINYLVHTYNKEKKQFANKLSDYDDLKVHVEGGYINGYYNVAGDSLYTPDNDDDWVYYEERANLENITILGRYEILQFELNDVVNYVNDKGETVNEKGLAYYFPEQLPTSMPNSPAFTAPNQRINAIVEAWDRIFLSEKLTLGVASKADVDSMNKLFPRLDGNWENPAEIYNYDDDLYEFCDSIKKRDGDYGEYYNHHGLAYGTRSGYMYGSYDHSGYHINTTHSILACIATEAGPTWGPAHEIGHQHQALYTLNGEMEVTNNTFANIAAWYMGMGTSRVNGTEGNLAHVYDNFKAGNYIFGNNIWALTQRYYRLWLYYHRVGNNTQFFPRLFELIRQKPMERSYDSGSEMQKNDKTGEMENVGFQLTNGYRSYLHFYQLCCEAAQEDLTEFFRAYGCFVPVDGVFQGDYTNSKYYTTQEEIDKAIAEVKAKNYPVNNKVLFINDCTPDSTFGHDGNTLRSFWDPETGKGQNGEVGLYVDYLKEVPITGKYVYSLVNFTTRTPELIIEGGKGAVGFAIYNDKGEIKAFSNNHRFVLNKEVATQLRAGEVTLYAVSTKGDDIEVINKALQGTPKEQLEKLKEALEVAKGYLEKTDTTGYQIGYLIPDSITSYVALVAKVDTVIAKADTSQYKYGEWYVNLDAANAGILSNKSARVPLIPNNCYSIKSNIGRYIGISTSNQLNASEYNSEEVPENMQWKFIRAEEENTYYILNRETGKYITLLPNGDRVKAESTDIAKAVAFILEIDAPGEFYIQSAKNKNLRLYSFQNNKVNSGNQVGTNTKWKIHLEDNLLALPKTSTEDFLAIYYLIRDENGEQAYSYLSKMSADNGRITTQMNNDPYDFNYLYYFKQGSQEGRYTIHSCGTGKPVTIDGDGLFINKDTESVPEFAITINNQGTGFTISSDEKNWNIQKASLIDAISMSTEEHTIWKLQYVRTTSTILTGITIVDEKDEETPITEAKLFEGDSIRLIAKTSPAFAINHSVTWSSSDEAIATVDSNGKIKAIAEGVATITITANDSSKVETTCKITVKKNLLTKISVTPSKTTLYQGDSITLVVRTLPLTAADHSVTWSSSDESIATVNAETGKVIAVAVGEAIITATANDGSGCTSTCKLTVKTTIDTNIDSTISGLQIQSAEGAVIISGLTEGAVVSIYDTVGKLIATTIATDGTATINMGMHAGVFIVKVGKHSLKVSL